MTRRFPFLPAVVGMFVIAGWGSAAHAQTVPVPRPDRNMPVADISAGVTIQTPPDANGWPACEDLDLPCLSPRTVPNGGLTLSAAVNAGSTFAVVGEVSVFWNAWTPFVTTCQAAGRVIPPRCPGRDVFNVVPRGLMGARAGQLISYGRRQPHEIYLFGQLLVGVQDSSIDPPRRVWQPGVGVDTIVNERLRVRVEYDYDFSTGGTRDLSTGRFGLALVWNLGAG